MVFGTRFKGIGQGFFKGPLAKEYDVKTVEGRRPSVMEKQTCGIVSGNDIYRFYQDWYAELRSGY